MASDEDPNVEFDAQASYQPDRRRSDRKVALLPQCHTRWSDAALEQFAKRFDAYIEADLEWKKEARTHLDSLLADREKILGGKTVIGWIIAIVTATGAAWAFVTNHFHVVPK